MAFRRLVDMLYVPAIESNQGLILCNPLLGNKYNQSEGFLFSNGGDSDDSKEESKAEEKPAQEETPPQEEKPPQEETPAREEKPEPEPPQEAPRSRIETYNEFARFKDSSRPPDSHYPPGPGLGYRRSDGVRWHMYWCMLALTVIVVILISNHNVDFIKPEPKCQLM